MTKLHSDSPKTGNETSSQPTVDNCQTCIHYIPCRHRPHLGTLPEPHCYPNPANIQPCPHYEPEQD